MKQTPFFAPATDQTPAGVFVIAEIGVNHNGDADRARELVAAAAAAGADAVKLQLFRTHRLLSNQAMLAAYQDGQADSAEDLLSGLALSFDDMRRVGDAAREAGLRFVVTPFSLEDVADLAQLNVDLVKIASPDAVNTPLLDAAATLDRPLLISTGACESDELATAAATITRCGGALLQCVSAYPTPEEDAALGGIAALRQRWGVAVGYSDHTVSIETSALAVAAGAVVIEKHLTYDRTAPGPDHAASLDPAGFAACVAKVRAAATMMGPVRKAMLPIEADVRRTSRQSVCAARDVDAGHVLTRDDLTVRRPGTGIPAARLADCVGSRVRQSVPAGDLLRPHMLWTNGESGRDSG